MAAHLNPMGLMPPETSDRRVSAPHIPLMVVVTDVDGEKNQDKSITDSVGNSDLNNHHQSKLLNKLSKGILGNEEPEGAMSCSASSSPKGPLEKEGVKANTKWRRICKCFIGLKVTKKSKNASAQQKQAQASQGTGANVVVRRRSRSHSLHPGNRSPNGRLSVASISPSRSIQSIRSRLSSRSETDFYLFDMGNMSEILTITDIKALGKSFPPSAVGCPCVLTFSTSVDGYSLHTLYRKMESIDSPMILAILDSEGRAFGAVLSCPLRISQHFYGSCDSFLFRCGPPLDVFKWVPSSNFYFIHSEESFLRIGAGKGNCGLWLDDNLFHGRTEECATFGSPPLVEEMDFEVQAVEVWTFGQI